MIIPLILFTAMAGLVFFDLRLVVFPRSYPGYKPDIRYSSFSQESGIYWAWFYDNEPKIISDSRAGLVHIYKLSGNEGPGWIVYAIDENGSLYQKFRAVKDSLENNSQPIGVIFKEIPGFRGGSTRCIVMDFFSLTEAGAKVDTTDMPSF